MKKKVKVLLADNTPDSTLGIRGLLHHYKDYFKVTHVTDGWETVSTPYGNPDLIILYNNIPPEGIELLMAVKMNYPKARIMLFTRSP
jgi:DNA-binding NarL/FixJ family response regulator